MLARLGLINKSSCQRQSASAVKFPRAMLDSLSMAETRQASQFRKESSGRKERVDRGPGVWACRDD